MSDFFKQLFCDFNETFSIIIDDDGRVAYAYLCENEDIIGDVWLYNQSSSPLKNNWKDTEEMPFLNPEDFIKENLPPIENDNNVEAIWVPSEDGETVLKVEIFIRGRLIAKMAPKSLPGWSKLVTKDGPLAKVYN
jgi:hypothetical protein